MSIIDYINSYDLFDPTMTIDTNTKIIIGIMLIILGCVLIWIGYQRYKIQKEYQEACNPVAKKDRKYKW